MTLARGKSRVPRFVPLMLLVVFCQCHAALAASAAPAPAQAGHDDSPAARYAALVRDYRTHGATDRTLPAVMAFWRDNKPGSSSFAALDDTLAPVAVLLQCSLSWNLLLDGQQDESLRQLKTAGRLVGMRVMSDDRVPRIRAARRGWFLFAAWVWTVVGQHDSLEAHLERARDEFPDDVDLLIALGTAREGLPRLGAKATREPTLNRVEQIRAALFNDEAAACFRNVLEIDPARAEARMRLARLLIEGGRMDEARRELETAMVTIERLDGVRRRQERRVEHLVLFLLGAIDARAGSWSQAEREYARAMQVCPGAQVARIAQSHAALMAGDELTARKAVATLASAPFAAPADPCGFGDPWRDYSTGQAWRVPALLRSLWDEVRQ
jgi:tetratricopeptide (TPR) repeat protein